MSSDDEQVSSSRSKAEAAADFHPLDRFNAFSDGVFAIVITLLVLELPVPPGDVVRGDMPLTHWDSGEVGFLLDVRQPEELALESVPGAINIPLPELRARLSELPKDREMHVICRSGQRAYYAVRILLQNSFIARILSGGMLSRTNLQ